MSLSQQAQQVRVQTIAGQSAAQAAADMSTGSQITEAFRSYWTDLPVTWLGVVRGDHPVKKRRELMGETIVREAHLYHRIQVDDITVIWAMSDKPTERDNWRNGRFYLEVTCRDCQRPTWSEYMYTHGEFCDPHAYRGAQSSYDYARTPEQRASFLLQIAARLAAPTRCWDCAVGVEPTCYACGRAN